MSNNQLALAAALSLICTGFSPDAHAASRKPLGVYVHIVVNEAIGTYPGNKPTSAQLHSYLRSLYATFLADPAISGIAFGAHWDQTQPAAGTDPSSYDWSYLDDVFAAVTAAQKTVHLIMTPGVDAPPWLFAQIPSCDPLFTTGSAPANCGWATFAGFPEQQRADTNTIPLPWNPAYQAAWKTFLTSLNARYGSNPALVAVSIAGPIAASDEMILPTNTNTSAPQPSGLSPDATWAALIQHSFPTNAAYQNTDQAFIDAWKQAIDTAEQIFSGVTIFLSPDIGNDLPNYSQTVTPHADNTLFAQDCASVGKTEIMSCEAKTEVLSYFVATAGPNAKATQVGGMTASSLLTIGNIGIAGVKLLTALTPPLLGGAEFDFPLTDPTMLQPEGCPDPNSGCPGLTIEEGTYNVLTVFFNGTPAAGFYGGTAGTAPIQYVDVPMPDVQYAMATPCPATPSPTIGNISVHDLYARASRDLFAMAGQTVPLPPSTCTLAPPAPAISLVANAEGESPLIAPNTWVEIKGANLALPGDTRIWQSSDFTGNKMPTALDGVSVTVNGKAAYVYYISPAQVNILTPPDALSGSVNVAITSNAMTSAGFAAKAQALSPSFFVFNGGPYVAAVHPNGGLVGPNNLYPGSSAPAKPGEILALYATGFGATNVPVVAGSVAQGGTLATLPVVQIGGVTAQVQYAGLVAPGEFQFNVVVPSTLADGDQPITATYNGSATQAGTLITIHH